MLFQVIESRWIQEKLRLYSVGPCQSLSMMLDVFMSLLLFIGILSKTSYIALVIECLKGEKFQWNEEAQKSFELLKKKVAEAPILVLLDFNKMLKVDCDAFVVGIGTVLSQEGKPIAFFNEKLNECKKKYSTYDK